MKRMKPNKNEFKSYVCQQAQGNYNMLSKEARKAVCISKEKYDYILQHYEELSQEYNLNTESDEAQNYVRIANKHGF